MSLRAKVQGGCGNVLTEDILRGRRHILRQNIVLEENIYVLGMNSQDVLVMKGEKEVVEDISV